MKLFKKISVSVILALVCLCVFGGFTIPKEDTEALVTVYCSDGRILFLSPEDAEEYSESDGWSDDFSEITVDIWNTAGDNRLVLENKLSSYTAGGWSDNIEDVSVLMRNRDGKEKYVFKDYVEEYRSKDWEEVAKIKLEKASNIKAIALTFDDGPSNSQTDRLLDILDGNNAKATFFVLGKSVGNGSDCLKRMIELGMEIGSHGYDHTQLTKLDNSALEKHIQDTNAKIKEASGAEPTLLRPPYGSYNEAVKSAAGVPIVLWSVDTLDWKSRNADAVYSETMRSVRDGSIILYHDIYESTVDAIERLLPELKAEGYELVTVSELAEIKGKPLTAGAVVTNF